MTEKNKKEFDRSVCFTFFNSYLEQAIEVEKNFGAVEAYKYLKSLAEYGLYGIESSEPIIKMLVCGLKNTIDANQAKRAQGFSREDTEKTKAILNYKAEHPEATQRTIANAVHCSLGKVNSVLTDNNNDNIYTNTNPNSNSVNMNVNTNNVCSHETLSKEQRRLEELSDIELDGLKADLIAGKKAGKTYPVLYKEYHLTNGSLSANTLAEINEIKKLRKEELTAAKRTVLKEEIAKIFAESPNKQELLLEYTGLPKNEAQSFFEEIEILGKTVDDLIYFFEEYSRKNEDAFTYQNYCQKYTDCADSYLEFIKNIIDANNY